MNGTEKWLLAGALILTVGLTFYAFVFGRKLDEQISTLPSRETSYITPSPTPRPTGVETAPSLSVGIDGPDRNIATIYNAHTNVAGHIVVFETSDGKLAIPLGTSKTFTGDIENYYIKLTRSVSPTEIIVAQLYNKSASQSGEYVSVARTQVIISGLDK